MKRLRIIGGVAAGMSAAAKARRINPELDIKVFTDNAYISYSSCGLPYYIGGIVKSPNDLIARTTEHFAQQGTKVHTMTRALEIKPDVGLIILEDLTTHELFTEEYDCLIIATGARAVIPSLDGINLRGIFTLRDIQDSQAIKAYLQEYQSTRAVVIGAGYIGLEMVENLRAHGCQVRMIEKSPQILPVMDQDMAQVVASYMESQGIEVLTDSAVTAFRGDDRVREVVVGDNSFPADIVILSIGVLPNSEIAGRAGIELGAGNAIRVNRQMATNLPGIYAAGDCATVHHIISDREVYLPMGTTANKQGRIAGENAAGGSTFFKGVLGTGISRIMELEISRTGLCEQECRNLGIDFITRTIKSRTMVPFFPESGRIRVKILVETHSRRLLGGQIVGYPGSGKRIDTIAAALTLNCRIDDLINMDLAYAPPFSPLWDPVLTAINKF
jgi:NADPH-dependent 2,4-dienoyl-CoA reductase/sulfur reductase-like enzyme